MRNKDEQMGRLAIAEQSKKARFDVENTIVKSVLRKVIEKYQNDFAIHNSIYKINESVLMSQYKYKLNQMIFNN